MNRAIKEFGAYTQVKGFSVLLAEMYRGWEIRRLAGGPGQEVGQWLFQGILKDSKQMPGHDIETAPYPALGLVRKEIDHFQESDYAETKQ